MGRSRPRLDLIRRCRALAGALGALAVVLAGTPASAHRAAPTGRTAADGAIVIPNLAHGQMRVVAVERGAIEDLADRQFPTDPTMRRLQGFIAIQRFACLWGVMPGSVTDEASPFNDCSHAYLAATRALLVHLRAMPGDRTETNALVVRVELEMLADGASLELCRYSDEPFDTADYVAPHWAEIPTHAPTALAFGAPLALACGCTWFVARRRRSALPIEGERDA